MTATDPAELTAIEARRLIARRKLSPVELAEACIARVEMLDHALNAMPARDFDRLRTGGESRREGGQRRPPAGVRCTVCPWR